MNPRRVLCCLIAAALAGCGSQPQQPPTAVRHVPPTPAANTPDSAQQDQTSDDPDWGHLSGRFVFDGQPPVTKPLRVDKDQEAFTSPILDESLVVNADNRGLANVVVYLFPATDGELRVHPSYAETAEARVTLAMQGGRFEPHVLLLRTSQTLVEVNRDAVAHHANIQFTRNQPG